MSPFEQHFDELRDMPIPGRGEGPPGVEPDPEPGSDGGAAPDGEVLDEAVLDDEHQEELAEEDLEREAVKARAEATGSGPGPIRRLYRGETSFDFVGRRRLWFLISTVVIVAGLVSLGVRGLNLGIEFKGGTAWMVKTNTLSQTEAENLVTAAGLNQPTVEVLGHGGAKTIEVQADLNSLSTSARKAESKAVIDALARGAHVSPTTVSVTHVGPTWGSQVTQRALVALIVFLVVVAVYISIRFEPKMAVAAFVALLHDLLVTAGVYSLAGFQVTPDTVIAVLTILGYSLYDTVVVFDRVRDNSKGFGASGRMTYSEMVNLSMNQTLARSINTSLVAILPVLAVLLIGAQLLGATTLQYYGLALTVGLLSGAYSSIFIASPVLAVLKEREPRYATIRQRLEARGERVGLLTPAAAALVAGGGGSGGSGGSNRPAKGGARPAGTLRPGAVRSGTGARSGAGGATARATAPAPARAAVGAPTGGGTARPAGTGSAARRPPPRPRKGGGKKGKKRR